MDFTLRWTALQVGFLPLERPTSILKQWTEHFVLIGKSKLIKPVGMNGLNWSHGAAFLIVKLLKVGLPVSTWTNRMCTNGIDYTLQISPFETLLGWKSLICNTKRFIYDTNDNNGWRTMGPSLCFWLSLAIMYSEIVCFHFCNW